MPRKNSPEGSKRQECGRPYNQHLALFSSRPFAISALDMVLRIHLLRASEMRTERLQGEM
jgi:hypothetical protein